MGNEKLEESLVMTHLKDRQQIFSKQEMDVIRVLLEYPDTKAALAGMSIEDGSLERKLGKRGAMEFTKKLSHDI